MDMHDLKATRYRKTLKKSKLLKENETFFLLHKQILWRPQAAHKADWQWLFHWWWESLLWWFHEKVNFLSHFCVDNFNPAFDQFFTNIQFLVWYLDVYSYNNSSNFDEKLQIYANLAFIVEPNTKTDNFILVNCTPITIHVQTTLKVPSGLPK